MTQPHDNSTSGRSFLSDSFIEEVNTNFLQNEKENILNYKSDSEISKIKHSRGNTSPELSSYNAQKSIPRSFSTSKLAYVPTEGISLTNSEITKEALYKTPLVKKLTGSSPESFFLNESANNSLPNVSPEIEKKIPPIGVFGWKEVAAHNRASSIKILPVEPTHFKTDIFIYVTLGLAWVGMSLGAGFSLCLFILGFCSTYYRKILERFSRAIRDDLLRDIWVKKLENESETVAWLNNFLERFWVIYEPGLSASIKDIIDGILEVSTPPFLESLSLSIFQLGNKAPFLYNVKTLPCNDAGMVIMDWDLEFMPSNVVDMTKRQIDNQILPRMFLQLRVGKGMVGAGMPVLVENFSIKGKMRVRVTFGAEYPHIDLLGFQFLERPTIDYVLKPVGGESFGFDIAHIPGLYSFIKDQIHTILSPMMYFPNEFIFDLQEFWRSNFSGEIVGVLRVNIRCARNLKQKDGYNDPYVQVTGSSKFQYIKTDSKNNTSRPDWNEIHVIVLYRNSEELKFSVFGCNAFRKDHEYGFAQLDLTGFPSKPSQNGIKLNLKRDSNRAGNLFIDCLFFPIIPEIDNQETSETLASKSGVLRLILHQIKDLDSRKSRFGKFNPYVSISINNKDIHQTAKKKKNNNPIFEESADCVINNIEEAAVSLTIKDDNGLLNDPIIAQWSHPALFLIKNRGWFSLNNVESGKIKVTSLFFPLEIEENQSLATQTSSHHFGVVRIHILEALQLKLFSPRSDIYVRVGISGSFSVRTNNQRGNFVPRWNQSFYIPVCSPTDIILLEIFENFNGESIPVGYIELQTSNLVHKFENGYTSKNLVNFWSSLSSNNGRAQGLLHFGAYFYTALDHNEQTFYREDTISKSLNESDLDLEKIIPDSYMLCLTIHGARGLEPGCLSASAYLRGRSSLFITETAIRRNTGSPIWEKSGVIFVTESSKETLSVVIQDQRSINVGKWEILASKLLLLEEKKRTWLSLGQDIEIQISYTHQVVDYLKIDDIERVLGGGHLTVNLIEAKNLVDSGTCDSFIKVKINHTRVFKSRVVKKTSCPVFGQDFTIPLLDISSCITIEVFDSNKISLAERLGEVTIPLKDIGSENSIEKSYFLGGSTAGEIKMALTFVPSFLDDEELQVASAQITGAPLTRNTINLSVGSFISGQIDRSQLYPSNLSFSMNPKKDKSRLYSRKNIGPTSRDATGRPGKLQITLMSAVDLAKSEKYSINPYVKVRYSGKVIYTSKAAYKQIEPAWNELFNVTLYDGGPCWLHFSVMNHNRIQSDRNLGEISLNIWDYINPDGMTSHHAKIWTRELRGGEPGRLQLDIVYLPL